MADQNKYPLHQGKNIYLSGFMASGKSTVGRLLSLKLQRLFVDTDDYIESLEHKTVKEIFETHGENYFRNKEAEVLKKFSVSSSLVVSLGGGAVMNPESRQVISQGLWIFINTDFNVIKERLQRSKRRPLAQDMQKVEALYNERLPTYKTATLVVDGAGDSELICQSIINRILGNENS